MLEKFGRPESERRDFDPIAAALEKAVYGGFVFQTDSDREKFVKWTAASRQSILDQIPFFSRSYV